jgi:hypothetical protein
MRVFYRDVDDCGIGDKGAVALAAELAGSQLETLDLSKSNPYDLDLATKLMAPLMPDFTYLQGTTRSATLGRLVSLPV